jgi:adenylate cyclase
MKLGENQSWGTNLLVGLGAFVVVCGLWRLGCLQPAELWIYDHLVCARAGAGTDDPRILLVSIEESDIRQYDYPLRDQVLAGLLGRIERDGPRAIGLDLYRDLPEPRNGSELPALNQVLAQNPNIICIFKFGTEAKPFEIGPPPILAGAPDRIGFNDFADNKTIRRGLIYLPDSFQYSSLAWQLALLYLAPMGIGPGPGEGGAVALGKTTFRRFQENDGGYVNAETGGYQFLMDYQGPQSFKTFTVNQVLTAAPAGTFRDKIVLIGTGAISSSDVKGTPFNQLETGLSIHGRIINQFLRAAIDGAAPTVSWGPFAEAAWILGWCLLATAVGSICHSSWIFGEALFGMLVLLAALVWLAFLHHLWLPAAAPGAAILLAAGAVKAYVAQNEARQRSVLMGLFSQHVSSDVAQVIWERRAEFLDGNRPRAQRLMATVLFTDLKDYSTLSEKLEPEVLMQWVDECLGGLGRHVARNGGMINKFMGDAVMAVFGAPLPHTTEKEIRQDAVHAVQCALDMKKEIEELNARWKARGWPEARMRIGIYTGIVMGGLVGNNERLEYTTIGNTTNTAARLESVDKDNVTEEDGLCRVLVGESTFKLVQDRFAAEFVTETKLKGQNTATLVYRILRPV